VKLRQANQGQFEFAAERGIGRADARNSAVGFSWDQKQNGLAPVGQGFQPAASVTMEPSGIPAKSQQIVCRLC
jgi:hypothetical protein